MYGPETFQPKFLNIMDPMLATNNLGRSVSKANAARIRTAWAHAAQTLSGIMQQVPAEYFKQYLVMLDCGNTKVSYKSAEQRVCLPKQVGCLTCLGATVRSSVGNDLHRHNLNIQVSFCIRNACRTIHCCLRQEPGVALAGLQRFFARVCRCRQVQRPLPVPHLQHSFLLPPPPHVLAAMPAVNGGNQRLPLGLQQQQPSHRSSHPGAGAQMGRHSRANGAANGQLLAGWHPGLLQGLPPEMQRAHAAAAAAAAAGAMPSLRRQPMQERANGGKDGGGRQRLPQHGAGGGRAGAKPGQLAGLASAGDVRAVDMRNMDLRSLADMRTGSATDMHALDRRDAALDMRGGSSADMRSERGGGGGGRQPRGTVPDMLRSYSADGPPLSAARAALLANYGLVQLPHGQHPDTLPQVNGFAGAHADAARLRGLQLRRPTAALAPGFAPAAPPGEQPVQHQQQQQPRPGHSRSGSVSDPGRNPVRSGHDLGHAGKVSSLTDLAQLGSSQPQPTSSMSASLPASLTVTPAARRPDGSMLPPPPRSLPNMSGAASAPQDLLSASDARRMAPSNIASVRSHSSGQLGRPPGVIRPIALVPPLAGSSQMRRQPPPPPPPQHPAPQQQQQRQQQPPSPTKQAEMPAMTQAAAEALYAQQRRRPEVAAPSSSAPPQRAANGLASSLGSSGGFSRTVVADFHSLHLSIGRMQLDRQCLK